MSVVSRERPGRTSPDADNWEPVPLAQTERNRRVSDAISVSGPINAAGLEMTLETGELASLAAGAVLVTVGGTTLLSTVATSKPREGIDFFPLTVDVEERAYAAGKIPGSFFRREGRPGELAILTCRLTDRPLRPSFPADFRNEVQVIATILGVDLENPHDVASINGASAALTVSGIPFDGPIGAVRLAHHNGEWIAHPTFQEGDESTFEIVVAGRQLDDGDVAIMMVEAGGTERTWELYEEGAPKMTEELIAQGLEESKKWIAASIELQKKLRDEFVKARGPIAPIEYMPNIDYTPAVYEAVKAHAETATAAAMAIADKNDRNAKPRRDPRGHRRLADRHRRRARRARRAGGRGQEGVPVAAEGSRPPAHRQRGRAHRRSRCRRHPAALGRGRRARHRARHGPVPAGRDAGALGRDARHAAHGADARHDHARDPQEVHAPLQLPAVLHGGDRAGRFAEAPRDRSRCAGRAGARSRCCRPAPNGRTRCGSSPTCSRRTAPRRWRRSAARRSR